MKTQHTQGKLVAHELFGDSIQKFGLTVEGKQYLVGESQDKADAERLALCWNMHDELLKTIKDLLECLPADFNKWQTNNAAQTYQRAKGGV